LSPAAARRVCVNIFTLILISDTKYKFVYFITRKLLYYWLADGAHFNKYTTSHKSAQYMQAPVISQLFLVKNNTTYNKRDISFEPAKKAMCALVSALAVNGAHEQIIATLYVASQHH